MSVVEVTVVCPCGAPTPHCHCMAGTGSHSHVEAKPAPDYVNGMEVEYRNPSDPYRWHPGVFLGWLPREKGLARVVPGEGQHPAGDPGLVSSENLRPRRSYAALVDRAGQGFDQWWDSLPFQAKLVETKTLAWDAWMASRAALVSGHWDNA